MIARPNQIAEEKGGGKSVREIDKEGSQLRGRVQGGTESRCFSTAIAALVLQYPSGAVQSKRIGAEKGDSSLSDADSGAKPHLEQRRRFCPQALCGTSQSGSP
jgi:hypothetical protein